MRPLRQYWDKIFSRLRKSSVSNSQHATGPEDLERELSAISGESQALAEEVQRVRTDFEHAMHEDNRKIADLEQLRQAMELARNEDHRKLAELESSSSLLKTAREADSSKIIDLERRLAELESERNQARDKAKALADSLAETTTRLENTDLQVKDLQVSSVEQAKQFKASLADAGNRLESTDTHVREMENRLQNERQDYLKTFEVMQGRFRKQDVRMNWTIAVAGFALLLGTVAGAVLIWDVQKNATLLTSMSQDIKELMTSMDGHLSMQHTLQEEQRQRVLAATSPEPETALTAKPASSAAAESQPAAAVKATSSAPDPTPTSLDSAPDRALSTNREGIRQSTRKDAQAFFEQNAKAEGVVSLPSGVQYRVVNPGSGKSPSISDKVVVTYVGVKLDGTVFDETYSTSAPSTFSMKELLPGWREVLLKMEEGTEFELYVPPNLATKAGVRKRGMLGFEPNIYLIELLEVVKEGATDPAAPAD